MSQQRITIVLEDGDFKGASQADGAGSPQPLSLAELESLMPSVQIAAVAKVEELKASQAAAIKAEQDKRAAELDRQRLAYEEQIAALQGKPAPSAQGKIAALSEAFKSQIPPEFQTNPDLLSIFAIVNVLISAGESDMAAIYIQNAVVPAELEAKKPAFIDLINPPE